METLTNIVIPWRDSGCKWRRRSFEYVMRHMEKYNPIVSDDGATPFSRSGSKNLGASLCTDDVVMFVDADTVIPHDQIDEALQKAREGYLAYPYTYYHAMSSSTTEDIYQGFNPNGDISHWSVTWATGGGMAISKETFEKIGKYDENFIDWGMEDAAILVMARKAGIEEYKVEGNCYHLWHPRQEENDNIRANIQRYKKEYMGEE